MSLDERRRVSETDLFPAFALRLCQLTQSNPLLTPAPHTHRLSDLGELCLPSEWVPTHHGAVTSRSYLTEFCLRCELMMLVTSHVASIKSVVS